jgi:hypothetical protein
MKTFVILKTIKKIFSKKIWYYNLGKPAEKGSTQMNPTGDFQIHGILLPASVWGGGFRYKKGD